METSGVSSVIDPLLAIEREDLTGVLEFVAHGITTTIHARSGEIVFADAGSIGETLGRMLIRAGRLTEEQVAAVIRRMTDALVDDEHVRFGEIVVEYGFLDAGELELALTQQVKEKVMGCVHRGPGKWTFVANDPRVEEVGSYVVRTRPMLVEAAAHLPERRLEELLHLDENRYPEIVAPESIVAAEFELSKAESLVLRDLDGTSSLHFILSKAASPAIAPLVAALVLGGGIELKTAPTRARQASESRPIPPEFRTARRARFVLPEDRTAPMAAPPVAKTALGSPAGEAVGGGTNDPPPRPPTATSRLSAVSFSTLAVPPPERRSSRQNLAPPTADTEHRAREALDRLKSDLDRKKPISKRRRWPEPKDDRERRLMAESAFHQGRLFLRAEQAERALPGLHRAFELCPEQREYELYVKWAQMLVNDTFKDDAHRREIQTLATTLVKEDRDCELGFSILGHCAMHDGKDAAALRFFQRAATLDPKLVDAARLARLLAMRATNEPKRSSTPEAQRRAKGRGLLDTPLDEIVPMLLQKASDALSSSAGGGTTKKPEEATPARTGHDAAKQAQLVLPAAPSPDGTLEGLPPPAGAAIERVPSPAPPAAKLPPPSMPPRPAPPELSPPPVPSRPPPSPWRLRATPAKEATTEPSPVAVATAQPLAPRAPIPAPAMPAPRAASLSSEELPTGRPRRGRATVVAGWIVSLGITAGAFYALGARSQGAPETAAVTTIDGARTSAAPSATEPPIPTATASLAHAAPATSTSAAPAHSSAKDDGGSKTGVLRTPKGYGRRVYVDGHIIGEGGRDHTVACGAHRVRVGSTGTERHVTIPCGGTIEVD